MAFCPKILRNGGDLWIIILLKMNASSLVGLSQKRPLWGKAWVPCWKFWPKYYATLGGGGLKHSILNKVASSVKGIVGKFSLSAWGFEGKGRFFKFGKLILDYFFLIWTVLWKYIVWSVIWRYWNICRTQEKHFLLKCIHLKLNYM